MTIDILCKVVDNYGDIGLVYRLARAFRDLDPEIGIRILVDKLEAFRDLAPGLELDSRQGPGAGPLSFRGLTIIPWDEAWEGLWVERPRFVVECFACGRPEWFDALLYDPGDEGLRRVVNLEYLSAEDYARDFHLMPSATRSALVKKTLFMPGFCPGTGGLIIDKTFQKARETFLDPGQRPGARKEALVLAGLAWEETYADLFWVSVFTYERDYARLVSDLAAWGRPILALVAPGRSAGPFLAAWESSGRPFPALALPFLPQEAWDRVLLASDLAIVRGEESLARAVLSGRPFLWHAYVQDKKHQLVKVGALLDRMAPFFPTQAFSGLKGLFLAFNDRETDGPDQGGQEEILPVLEDLGELETGFQSFSDSVMELGDLASHLLTFFRDFG